MKQIVEWLVYIEDWASRIYEELAPAYRDDKPLYRFIEDLAADEAMHFHFMNSALICLGKNPDISAEIILDNETVDKVEAPLKKIDAQIRSGKIDRSVVLESGGNFHSPNKSSTNRE
jgi:rubrerythrin